MNAPEYPTPWQRKAIWSALTTAAVVSIGGVAVGLVWVVSQVLGFLQPILVPFAAAGVLAYLLDPLVSQIVRWGTSRHRAVLFVFAIVTTACIGISFWIIPAMWTQSNNLARKVPHYTAVVGSRMVELSEDIRNRFGITLLPPVPHPADSSEAASAQTSQPERTAEKTTPIEAATTGTADVPPPAPADAASGEGESTYDFQKLLSGTWLQDTLRLLGKHVINLLRESLGGFLGVLGFLVSLVIVPIYLFYFLIEAPSIATSWSDYVPLRASAFRDEVVSVLNEINGYLIAFFRGQLVVSMINGAVTGIGLVIAGLEFGLLIGLALCFLGIIPYLGITMCWIVSLAIASVQGGSWCVPAHPWYLFPVVISAIFLLVQNLDGLFVTPRIVGESVGLHPLTVIFSVFVWSLLMGGLLGAILAVPMTATLKVLLRRYVWERRFRLDVPAAPPREAPAAAAMVAHPLPEPEAVAAAPLAESHAG